MNWFANALQQNAAKFHAVIVVNVILPPDERLAGTIQEQQKETKETKPEETSFWCFSVEPELNRLVARTADA